jgi:hypothetical protein
VASGAVSPNSRHGGPCQGSHREDVAGAFSRRRQAKAYAPEAIRFLTSSSFRASGARRISDSRQILLSWAQPDGADKVFSPPGAVTSRRLCPGGLCTFGTHGCPAPAECAGDAQRERPPFVWVGLSMAYASQGPLAHWFC